MLNYNATVVRYFRCRYLTLILSWHCLQMPALAAEQVLPTKMDSADIELAGHFSAKGFLQWREGLTLADAIEAAQGFDRYATSVVITPRDWDTMEPQPIRKRISTSEAKDDSIAIAILLEKGDSVVAEAVFAMRSDPKPLVSALERFYSLLESDIARGRESGDTRVRKFANAIRSIRYEGMALRNSWLAARLSKDDLKKMEQYLKESMESLAKVERVVANALSDFKNVDLEVPVSEAQMAGQSVLDEIKSYRAAIEKDFLVEP